MQHIRKHTRFVILSAALAWTFPLLAADDIDTRWTDLCLGAHIKHGLEFGAFYLGLPYTPIGAAIIPATLVWGAVAAPFCLLADLGDNGPTTQEIKVID